MRIHSKVIIEGINLFFKKNFILYLLNGAAIGMLAMFLEFNFNLLFINYSKLHSFYSSAIAFFICVNINYFMQQVIFNSCINKTKFYFFNSFILITASLLNYLLSVFFEQSINILIFEASLSFIISYVFITPLAFYVTSKYIFSNE